MTSARMGSVHNGGEGPKWYQGQYFPIYIIENQEEM